MVNDGDKILVGTAEPEQVMANLLREYRASGTAPAQDWLSAIITLGAGFTGGMHFYDLRGGKLGEIPYFEAAGAFEGPLAALLTSVDTAVSLGDVEIINFALLNSNGTIIPSTAYILFTDVVGDISVSYHAVSDKPYGQIWGATFTALAAATPITRTIASGDTIGFSPANLSGVGTSFTVGSSAPSFEVQGTPSTVNSNTTKTEPVTVPMGHVGRLAFSGNPSTTGTEFNVMAFRKVNGTASSISTASATFTQTADADYVITDILPVLGPGDYNISMVNPTGKPNQASFTFYLQNEPTY